MYTKLPWYRILSTLHSPPLFTTLHGTLISTTLDFFEFFGVQVLCLYFCLGATI